MTIKKVVPKLVAAATLKESELDQDENERRK